MYGCFDLAEQFLLMEVPDFGKVRPKECSPFMQFRALNPFIHTQALEDRNSWFFDDQFWQNYLDQLAISRHNFLDFHACYDLVTTQFPNIYPYLLKIEKYPNVGVDSETAERNLEQFSKIVKMAKDRGIKVGLMSYVANWDMPERKTPPPDSDEKLANYTALCVKKLIEHVPELEFLGFRVGESGKRADFYRNSYIKGLEMAGRKDVKLYTRSWMVSRRNIELIADSYPGDMYIEIKYNGEHLGMPYQVSGGWMSRMASYSYQSYSTLPRSVDLIWQVRANGTHRIFPWGDPEFVSRSVKACSFLGAIGYTVEPLTAYYPLKNYYTNWVQVDYDYCDYLTERDWFWYALWGRLGYNPDVQEQVWINMFNKRFGNAAGEDVYKMFVYSSRIIPTVYSYRGIGPDHRNIAPEMEWGGPLSDWVYFTPLEVGSYMNVGDYVDVILNNKKSGRLTPVDIAKELMENSSKAVEYGKKALSIGVSEKGQKEFEYLLTNTHALQALADYYANKLKAAITLELARKTENKYYCNKLEYYLEQYIKDWKRLSNITGRTYAPFLETLRQKGFYHHWKNELTLLKQDRVFVEEFIAKKENKQSKPPLLDIEAVKMTDIENAPKVNIVDIETVKANDKGGKVIIKGHITGKYDIAVVKVYYKKMPSTSNWQVKTIKMKKQSFVTEIPITYEGVQFRIETVDAKGHGIVWPDVRETVPYISIPGWPKPDTIKESEYCVNLGSIKIKAYKHIQKGLSGIGKKVYLDNYFVMQSLPEELIGLDRVLFKYADVKQEVFDFKLEFTEPTILYIAIGQGYPSPEYTLHGFSRYKDAIYRHNERDLKIYTKSFEAGVAFFSFDYGGHADCVIVGFKENSQ